MQVNVTERTSHEGVAYGDLPTVWGLTPVQLHDRYWASRGVYVVRAGEMSVLPRHADLFLLMDDRTLSLFDLRDAANRLFWVKPDVLFVRFRDALENDYREFVQHDAQHDFVSFQRQYRLNKSRPVRIALTLSRRVAELWQMTPSTRERWRDFRRQCRAIRSEVFKTEGRSYRRADAVALDRLVKDLVDRWENPGATIDTAEYVGNSIWGTSATAKLHNEVIVHSKIWVGSGRELPEHGSVVGPAVLWDDPQHRPAPRDLDWQRSARHEPPVIAAARVAEAKRQRSPRRPYQRLFDLIFSTLALCFTLPFYPLVLLAIWLEDGRPFFFLHLRETTGGREFWCIKFRTMRKDATASRTTLNESNVSDGPQFFIRNDPRVTRVGRVLRALNFDELPQFWNVIRGEMSIVGPRPSPKEENQYSPAWREARLSVRPGITGLWQVSRTRQTGLDFQEWIRYDVAYVERAGLLLDLKIVLKTFRLMIKG